MSETPTTSSDVTEQPPAPSPAGPIVARAGRYYRNARYLMFAMIVGMGLWFGYDGFVKYPEHNRRHAELRGQLEVAGKAGNGLEVDRLKKELQRTPLHSDDGWFTLTDIPTQRTLSFLLPPLGIALLARWLHKSRGEVRLDGGVLHAPGHPPVPLGSIKSIDDRLWDRKGIAGLTYDVDGRSGKITLDDFVYEREPIDAIYDEVNRVVRPEQARVDDATDSGIESERGG